MKKIIIFSILFFSFNSLTFGQYKFTYNGVQVTDADINNLEYALGNWIKQNSSYSSDVRKWDKAVTQIVSELRKGYAPIVSPTGAVTIGSFQTKAGQRGTLGTNFNLFGNIHDERGLAGDKTIEWLNNLAEAKRAQNDTQSQNNTESLPNEKFHTNIATTLSNRYFAGNWDNAKQGIKYWDTETKRQRVRQGLIDVINSWKENYGEDSRYISKLQELNDPNISVNELIDVAFSIGENILWIFE